MTSSDDILELAPPKSDERIPYGPDPNQFIDLRVPKSKGPYPLAICLHGGYWRAKYNLEYLGHLCAALTLKGIATANVEYRRVGNPGGGWPGTFADIRAAYQLLAQKSGPYSFDAQRIIAVGHSAGGQLSLCLSSRESKLKAGVSLAGVLDLRRAYDLHLSNDAVVEFLGGTPKEVPDHYREADPMGLKISIRQFLVFGDADEHVPPALSRDYGTAKKKLKEDITSVEIAGAGHFEIVDPRSKAWSQVETIILAAAK